MADQVTPVLGQQQPTDDGSQFNAITFICRQIVDGRVNTASLVKVVAVHGGGVGPVGTVDVQPLVNQIDGAGTGTPHGILYGLPYIRIQGGANALIFDPVVGDIGQAIYCSTDISTVKVTKAQANPASRRRFSMADGVYLGGTLNSTPINYVFASSSGIAVVSSKVITMTDGFGSELALNNDGTSTWKSNVTIEGTLHVTEAVTGDSTAEFTGEGTFNGGHTVSQHTHTQPNDSHGDTEAPTNTPTG
jgi:hypothetical protein